jgi:hypothetical protein
MGLVSGHKYRVKSTNLFEEATCKYGTNHMLFQEPSKERPQKGPKFHGPQQLSQSAVVSSPAVPNMAGRTESCPCFGKSSESEDDNPHIPGIFSQQVDTNLFKHVPALYKNDARVTGTKSAHSAPIPFHPYLRAKKYAIVV